MINQLRRASLELPRLPLSIREQEGRPAPRKTSETGLTGEFPAPRWSRPLIFFNKVSLEPWQVPVQSKSRCSE